MLLVLLSVVWGGSFFFNGIALREFPTLSIVTARVQVDYWKKELRSLVKKHAVETESRRAQEILRNWDIEVNNFIQICPKEMLNKLENPISFKSKVKKVS